MSSNSEWVATLKNYVARKRMFSKLRAYVGLYNKVSATMRSAISR